MTDFLPFPCFGCSSNVDHIDAPTKDYYNNPSELLRAIEKQNWDVAREILKMNPHEATEWVSYQGFGGVGSYRRLPIHEACMRKPPEEVIESLIRSYPKGVREKDSDGQLPLHHACENGASLAVIKQLLLACPDSIDVRNKWGNFPIDIAKSTNSSPEVVNALKKRPSYYAVYDLTHKMSTVQGENKDLLRKNKELSSLKDENEELRRENAAYKKKMDHIRALFDE